MISCTNKVSGTVYPEPYELAASFSGSQSVCDMQKLTQLTSTIPTP